MAQARTYSGTTTLAVTVVSTAAVEAALDGLGKAVARKLGRAALRAGATPIAAAVRARISRVTGNLAAGLRVRIGTADRPGRLSVLIQSRTTREAFAGRLEKAGRRARAADVRSKGADRDRYNVYYGAAVERGHAGPWGKGARTPAHPFMGPGFDSTVEQAANTTETVLVDLVADYWSSGRSY